MNFIYWFFLVSGILDFCAFNIAFFKDAEPSKMFLVIGFSSMLLAIATKPTK